MGSMINTWLLSLIKGELGIGANPIENNQIDVFCFFFAFKLESFFCVYPDEMLNFLGCQLLYWIFLLVLVQEKWLHNGLFHRFCTPYLVAWNSFKILGKLKPLWKPLCSVSSLHLFSKFLLISLEKPLQTKNCLHSRDPEWHRIPWNFTIRRRKQTAGRWSRYQIKTLF